MSVPMTKTKLMLGDCLERMREIPDGSVDVCLCDPPYGISYQSAWRTDKTQWRPKLMGDNSPFVGWIDQAYAKVKSGGCVLCFCEWRFQEIFRKALEDAGFKIKSHIIWDREWHGMGDLKASFAPRHDVVWFGVKGKYTFPGKRPHDVIRCKRIAAEKLMHATEKPVELLEHLILHTCAVGGSVFDPCMGSGSTGVACVNTGRNFIGIELDEVYFDIARRRISEAQCPVSTAD